MKLRLQFGATGPKEEINWWTTIKDFPVLISHNNKKWEFVMYQDDPANQVDYVCMFSEVQPYDPNWYSNMYATLDGILGVDNEKCECGKAFDSGGHMFYCKKWEKF